MGRRISDFVMGPRESVAYEAPTVYAQSENTLGGSDVCYDSMKTFKDVSNSLSLIELWWYTFCDRPYQHEPSRLPDPPQDLEGFGRNFRPVFQTRSDFFFFFTGFGQHKTTRYAINLDWPKKPDSFSPK